MQPESNKLLQDMRTYATNALDISRGRTLEQYEESIEFRLAIERCFTVIGEAMAQLRTIDLDTAVRVTDWRSIVRFRNILVHGYGVVDAEETWDTLVRDVPVLINELDVLLAEPIDP